MTALALRLGVADLLRHPGTRQHVAGSVPVDVLEPDGPDALGVAEAFVDAAIEVDLVVESMPSGAVVTGTLDIPWKAPCRRCLEAVSGRAIVPIREVFEVVPQSEDVSVISPDDTIDLGPIVREEALCALPLSVLCGPDCRGPVPEAWDDGDEPQRDPRWAALDALRSKDPG